MSERGRERVEGGDGGSTWRRFNLSFVFNVFGGWIGGGDGWMGGSSGKNKGTSIKSDAEIRRSIFLTWLRSVASHLSGGIETLLRKSFFPLDWHTHASI